MASLRLLSKNEETKKLVINERAIEFIQAIRGPISVAIIVGPYRSGKSFLINNLFHDNNDSFPVGHTDQSHTKGVWLSKKITEIRKGNEVFKLLIMDTEGLESLNNETWDTKLFLVSILMSSLFIYNTKCALSVDAFNKLSMIAEAGSKIQLKHSLSVAETSSELRNECPDFLWIVRDFALEQLKSSNEQLSDFLQNEPDESGDVDKANRNRIREAIKQTFRSQSCFYLQEPELDVNSTLKMSRKMLLQNLDKIDREDFSVEFRNELDELTQTVLSKLEPKRVKRQVMSGQMFCEYLTLIVEAVNEHKTFYLHDAMAKIEAQTLLDEEKSKYKQMLRALTTSYTDIADESEKPISLFEFDTKEKEISDACIASFREHFGIDYPNVCDELSQKFHDFKVKDDVDGCLNEIRSRVLPAMQTYYTKLANSKWNTQMRENCLSDSYYETMDEFESDLARFKTDLEAIYDSELELNDFDSFWLRFESTIQLDLIKLNLQRSIERRELLERLEHHESNDSGGESNESNHLSTPEDSDIDNDLSTRILDPYTTPQKKQVESIFPTPSYSDTNTTVERFRDMNPSELPMTKNGDLDHRFSVVNKYLGLHDPAQNVYLKKDRTPNMKYKVNKKSSKSPKANQLTSSPVDNKISSFSETINFDNISPSIKNCLISPATIKSNDYNEPSIGSNLLDCTSESEFSYLYSKNDQTNQIRHRAYVPNDSFSIYPSLEPFRKTKIPTRKSLPRESLSCTPLVWIVLTVLSITSLIILFIFYTRPRVYC